MTLEEQIAELLAKADPLRALPDDEAELAGLPGIVNQINALRAMQARQPAVVAPAVVEGSDADDAPVAAPEPEKRGPGRPRKAT